MDIEKEVIDNRTRLKMLEMKLDALIGILSKEGVVTKDEVDEALEVEETKDLPKLCVNPV